MAKQYIGPITRPLLSVCYFLIFHAPNFGIGYTFA